MTSFGFSVRSICHVSALAAVCLLTAQNGNSGTCPQTGPTATYRFAGQCTDCTGTGVGLLTLRNYTLGDELTGCNFVSFSYSSNLTSFTITPDTLVALSGTLPASLPAPATVAVAGPDNNALISNDSGEWRIGIPPPPPDFGPTSLWSVYQQPNVPALSTPTVVGLAVMLALLGAFLLKAFPGRRAA
jgi:hypothetical protein